MGGLDELVSAMVAAHPRNQETYYVDKLYRCQIVAVVAYLWIIWPDCKQQPVFDDASLSRTVEQNRAFGNEVPFVELIGPNVLVLQNLQGISRLLRESLHALVCSTLRTCGCVMFKSTPELNETFEEVAKGLSANACYNEDE